MTNEEREKWEFIINELRKVRRELQDLEKRIEHDEVQLSIEDYCMTHTKDESYEDEYYNSLLEKIEE